MNWHKVWVVARHEYLTNIRRAGFIFMTAIVPVVGLIVLLLGALFAGQAQQIVAFLERQFDIGGKRIGVIDRSGRFSPILPAYRGDFILYEGEDEAKAALETDEIQMVLEIGEDYVETGRVVVITRGSGFDAAVVEDSDTVRAFFVDHLLMGEVDPALRKRAIDPVNADVRLISAEGERKGEGGWGIVFTFAIPYFLAILLMMTIFSSSGYLLQGVAEEKESRAIEIIISSIRPVELMAGKVAGLGALGLTQVLVWMLSVWGFTGGAMTMLSIVGTAGVPLRVLVLGVVYYLLGYTLYAILMAGVGALGTTTRESQQLAGLFSLFAMLPYMMSGLLFTSPNALLARVFSFFPLTAPTMMMMRLPLTEVGWVDIAGSILVLLLSIPAALWVGTRLFEVGLLIYGKRPTLREIGAILRGGGKTGRVERT